MEKFILIVSLIASGILGENIPPVSGGLKSFAEKSKLTSLSAHELCANTQELKQISFSANEQKERYFLNCL